MSTIDLRLGVKALLFCAILLLAVQFANCTGEPESGGGGDPILTDFTGVTFEFFGKGGQQYNLLSSQDVNINMHLFEHLNQNHTGTYMDKFGFSYNTWKVLITLADQEGDIIVQSWNEKHIPQGTILVSNEAKAQMITPGNGAVHIATEAWRPFTGRTVNITTGAVVFSVWSTPAGIVDDFNVTQPSYLNFNISLLAPPANGEVEGILGESLHRMNASSTAAEQAISNPSGTKIRSASPIKADEESYAVRDIFGTDFAFNKFSPLEGIAATRRALLGMENNPFIKLQFPIKATSNFEAK